MLNLFDKNNVQKTLLEEKDIEFTDEYIKLPNGFMIVYMRVFFNSGEEMVNVKFPIPFKEVYRTFSIHQYATEKYGFSCTGKNTLTSCDVYDKNLKTGFSNERSSTLVVIGRYK